jgi:hypothetical protein
MNEVARMEDRHEIEPTQPAAITPMTMIDRALATGAAPETLEKLLALQERWEASQGRKAFDEAIALAKAELKPVVKNREGHNNKRYADFAALARAVDPIISKHGLSYRFRSHQDERIHVTCRLSHTSGHSEETTLAGPADNSGSKNAIQAIGSTLTYLQRYSLVLALGLAASDDDDGHAAGMGEAVSDDQLMELEELLEEVKADRVKFCKFLGVDSLASLPAKQFQRAKSALEAKRQKGGAS